MNIYSDMSNVYVVNENRSAHYYERGRVDIIIMMYSNSVFLGDC